MPKYMALLESHQPGCDWSISCGKDFVELKSEKYEGAIDECFQIYEDHGGRHGDPKVDEIKLLEVSKAFPIDLSSYNSDREAEEEAEAQKMRDEEDREQYERLKKKFEGVDGM